MKKDTNSRILAQMSGVNFFRRKNRTQKAHGPVLSIRRQNKVTQQNHILIAILMAVSPDEANCRAK